MASPLRVRVDVDMDQLVRASRQAEDSTEDLADAYTDVNEESTDAARAAGRAMDNLDRDADQAASSVSQVGDAAGDVGGALSGLGDVASDALSGDVQGAADGALSALSGLASAIPGVGGLVGGALATLVGSLITTLDLFGTKTKEIAADTASALVDMGGSFDQAALENRVKELANDTQSWADANTIAAVTGRTVGDVLGAMAEGGDRLATVTDEFHSMSDAIANTNNKLGINNRQLVDAEQRLDGLAQGFAEGSTKIDAVKKAVGTLGSTAESSTKKVATLSSTVGGIPKVTETTVRVNVDDSAYRHWQPAPKYAQVQTVPGGRKPV